MEDYKAKAQALLRELTQAGVRLDLVAQALDGRVSRRTLYRWLKGDHGPQRRSDLTALQEVGGRLRAEHSPSASAP